LESVVTTNFRFRTRNQEAFDNLFEQFVRDEKPVGSVELELVGILPPDVAAQVFGRDKMAA
jgi:hypothetical protein